MKVLRIFRRKSKIVLDAQAKVEAAKGKVNEAFIMFSQANDAIQEANKELLNAAEEAEKDQKSYEAKAYSKAQLKEKALMAVKANNKLSEKLQDFLI